MGTTALKVVKSILKRKKERNLRSTNNKVIESEVRGGEILKKIIFESQRQMARTLLDKTSIEDHSLPKKVETQMLMAEATRKAEKALRTEKLKVRPATVVSLTETPKSQKQTNEKMKINRDIETTSN